MQGALKVVLGRMHPRGLEIRGGCGRIVRTVKMFRPQHGITPIEPLGGAAVQFAAPCFQERRVRPIADERMGKQEIIARRAHENMFDEIAANVGAVRENMAQGVERKLRPQHGRGLQRLAVGCFQPIHAR